VAKEEWSIYGGRFYQKFSVDSGQQTFKDIDLYCTQSGLQEHFCVQCPAVKDNFSVCRHPPATQRQSFS
jgi:hypothetical protein